MRDLDNEISRLDEEIANKEDGIKDREAELERWREGGMEETHPTYQDRLKLLNDERARLEAMKTEKAAKEARRSELLRKLQGRDLYGREGQRFADHDEVLDEIGRLEQRIGQLEGTRQDRLETTRGPDGKASARTVTQTTPGLIDRKKEEIEDLEGQLKETQDKIPPAQKAADALRADLHKVKADATAAATARKNAEKTKRQKEERERRLREQRDAEIAAIQRKTEHYQKKMEVIREFAPLKFTGPLALLINELDEEEAKDLASLMAVGADDPEGREALIELITELPKYVEASRQGADALVDALSGVPAGVTAAGGTLLGGRKVLRLIRSARFGVSGVFPVTNAALVGARMALLYWDIHDPTKPQAAMLYPVKTVADSRFVTDENYSDLWKGVEGADRRLRAVQIVENIQEFSRDVQAFARQLGEQMQDPRVKAAYDELQNNPELQDRFEEAVERVASQSANEVVLEKFVNSTEYQEWKFFEGEKVPLAEGQTLDEWVRAEAEDVLANPDEVDEDADGAEGLFRRFVKDFLRKEGLLGRLDDRGPSAEDERLASSQGPGADASRSPSSVTSAALEFAASVAGVDSLPDGTTSSAFASLKDLTWTDAGDNDVPQLGIHLEDALGQNQFVTADENGETTISWSQPHRQVVISGPGRSDYARAGLMVREGPATEVELVFDRPLTTKERREWQQKVAKSARKQTGDPDLEAVYAGYALNHGAAYRFRIVPKAEKIDLSKLAGALPPTQTTPAETVEVETIDGITYVGVATKEHLTTEQENAWQQRITDAARDQDDHLRARDAGGFEYMGGMYSETPIIYLFELRSVLETDEPTRKAIEDDIADSWEPPQDPVAYVKKLVDVRAGFFANDSVRVEGYPTIRTGVQWKVPELPEEEQDQIIEGIASAWGQPPSSTTVQAALNLGESGKTPVTIFATEFLNASDLYNPDGTLKIVEVDVDKKLKSVQAANPVVAWIGGQVTLGATVATPNDPHYQAKGSWQQAYPDQWAIRRVGFTPIDETRSSAWPSQWSEKRPGLTPCIVAVIGSGIDFLHPDLAGQVWRNPKEDPLNGKDDDQNGYVDDVVGWDFRGRTSDVTDYGGHDTHVAGVIGAKWNNGQGIAGINPAARIMALKVANYLGESDSLTVAEAIKYAVDHGARVINLSYAGPRPGHIFQLAVDYAVSKGVLVVGAAGNEGEDAAGLVVAGTRGVLTVAATSMNDKRVGFSNWGQPIDIAAPGLDVLSLRARASDFLLYFGQNPDYEAGTSVVGKQQDLYRAGGTSFAAPIVAGVASLLWSMEPELTLQQVRNKLLMSAEDIETPGWDQYTGVGLLNAKKAMEADPDYYLFARISKLSAARRNGQMFVDVQGQAEGSQFTGRWLQIGFGEEPGKDDWGTVGHSKEPIQDGLLGSIPISRFDRTGVWMVRLLAQDERQLVRQSRARLDLE